MLKVTHPQSCSSSPLHLYSGATVCATSSAVEITIPEIEQRIKNDQIVVPAKETEELNNYMRSIPGPVRFLTMTHVYLPAPNHWLALQGCANLLLRRIQRLENVIFELDLDGNIPLHYAAYAGHMEAVKVLARNSRALSIKNHRGRVPLCSAINSDKIQADDQIKVVKLLAAMSPCLGQLIHAHQLANKLKLNPVASLLKDFIACRMLSIALFQAIKSPTQPSPTQRFSCSEIFDKRVLKFIKGFLVELS